MNSITLNRSGPTGLTGRQTAGQFNNRLAEAYAMADPSYQLKQLDRAGFSRGGSQMQQAGANSARALADGIAAAYQGSIADESYNANLALESERARENNALAMARLQQQDNYAQQMAALQRQQAVMNFAGGLLGGLLD